MCDHEMVVSTMRFKTGIPVLSCLQLIQQLDFVPYNGLQCTYEVAELHSLWYILAYIVNHCCIQRMMELIGQYSSPPPPPQKPTLLCVELMDIVGSCICSSRQVFVLITGYCPETQEVQNTCLLYLDILEATPNLSRLLIN